MSSAIEATVFQFRCPRCYVALLTTTDRIGESIACPDCGTTSQIPEATAGRIAAAQTMPSSAASVPTSLAPAKSRPAPSIAADTDCRAAYEQFRNEYGVIASPLSRFVAWLIDCVCAIAAICVGFGSLGVLITVLQPDLPAEPDQLTLTVLLVIGFSPAVFLTICQWAWTATAGKTIGKKLMGIRIARRLDEYQPGFLQGVVLRVWLNCLLATTIPFYSCADLLFIFSHDGRCLHDRIAGTLVLEGNLPRKPHG